GKFKLTAGAAGLDADITVEKCVLPHFKANGVHGTIKDIGGENKWNIDAGDIDVDFEGILSGKWTGLGWNKSMTGGLKIDFKIPKLNLPSIDISILDGSNFKLPKPDFDFELPDIDFGKY